MYGKIQNQLENQLNEIREAGLYKNERVIESPQDARIEVSNQEVLNMCANNYLGLSDDARIVEAAHKALDEWGYGLSSVRFICGTQEIHKELERKISAISRHGRHDSLRGVFRCERRAFRAAV